MWGVAGGFYIVFLSVSWYRYQIGIQKILRCLFIVILVYYGTNIESKKNQKVLDTLLAYK